MLALSFLLGNETICLHQKKKTHIKEMGNPRVQWIKQTKKENFPYWRVKKKLFVFNIP